MNTRWFLAALASAPLSGCIERRFVIESWSIRPATRSPPRSSAMAYRSATRRWTIPSCTTASTTSSCVKDGYETLHVHQSVRTPWWTFPPLDFVVENVLPFHFRDIRRYRYTMQPRKGVRTEELLQRGVLPSRDSRSVS